MDHAPARPAHGRPGAAGWVMPVATLTPAQGLRELVRSPPAIVTESVLPQG